LKEVGNEMSEIKKPKRPLVPTIIGAVLLVLAWGTPAFLAGSRKSLVRSIGINMTDFLTDTLVWIFAAFGLVLLVCGLISLAKGAKKRRLYASPNADLEEQLMDQLSDHPGLLNEINLALRQLNRAQGSLEKFDKIIKLNAATSVQRARSGLEALVGVIVNNIKHVRNTLVQIDPENYDFAKAKISGILGKNKQALDRVAGFIAEVTDEINRINAGDLAILIAWEEEFEVLQRRTAYKNGLDFKKEE